MLPGIPNTILGKNSFTGKHIDVMKNGVINLFSESKRDGYTSIVMLDT
jgi:hypothetical protein